MEPTKHVYEAICNVMRDMAKAGIAKDRKNTQQGFSFRGIDDVYDALAAKLSEHKLCMLPRVVGRDRQERTTAKGGNLLYTILDMEFDLVSALDGSMHTIKTVGEAMDSGDKSSNKSMSAAYKYAAIQAFCIPVVGDDDADATTPPDSAPKSATPPPPPDPRPMLGKLLTDGGVPSKYHNAIIKDALTKDSPKAYVELKIHNYKESQKVPSEPAKGAA